MIVGSAGAQTWNGGAGTGNWSDAANWTVAPVSGVNTALIFDGNVQTTTRQNSASGNPFQLNSLTFAATAGTFQINPGNPLQFNPSAAKATPQILNNSPNTQMANVPVQINGTNLLLGGTGSGQLQLNAAVSDGPGGAGSVTVNGSGSYTLGAPTVQNLYSGNTTLQAGTLVIDNGQALGPKGTLSIVGGTIRAATDASQTIGNAFSLDGNGTFGDPTTTNSLTFTSQAVLSGNRSLTFNNALTNFAGGITDNGKGFGFTVAGDASLNAQKMLIGGRLKFGGTNNVFGGAVTINKGGAVTLSSGSFTSNAAGVTVNAGGFFGGNGSIKQGTGAKLVGQVFFKGAGYFKCPNDGSLAVQGPGEASTAVEFQSGSVFAEDIAGSTPGTGYTQLGVTDGYGEIDSGAILDINPTVPLTYGETFLIMTRDEAPPTAQNEFSDVNGNPLPEGDVFSEAGYQFQINYGATDAGLPTGGNDVLLTVVPEPAARGLLALAALILLGRRWRGARQGISKC